MALTATINPDDVLRRRRSVQRARMSAPLDRLAAEAAAEARAQPPIHEADHGQAVEYMPAAVPRPTSARATRAGNKLQHAAELLTDVRAGEKNIHEAAAEHGSRAVMVGHGSSPGFAN